MQTWRALEHKPSLLADSLIHLLRLIYHIALYSDEKLMFDLLFLLHYDPILSLMMEVHNYVTEEQKYYIAKEDK